MGRRFVFLLLPLIACEEGVAGFRWQVRQATLEDTCNEPASTFDETFDYVLVTNGAAVTIYVGPDILATGTQAGCDLDYASVIWAENRDGYDLRWQLTGEAVFRYGGSECNLPEGTDWEGTETFTILASEHPDIPAGCTYATNSLGTYLGPTGE